jgi:hypothetical protein
MSFHYTVFMLCYQQLTVEFMVLILHYKRRAETGGVSEQSAEENTWT